MTISNQIPRHVLDMPASAAERHDLDRRGGRLAAAAGVLGFAALVSVLLMPAVQVFPNGILEDDGYFYAQIAYNVATLGLSTFDGINVTSGYHLLWGGILSLASLLVTPFADGKFAHLFALVLLNVVIYAAVSWRMFDANVERAGAFALFMISSLLMETILLSALLLLIASKFLDRDRRFGREPLDLVLVFLVPLTRIDSSVVVGVLSLYFLVFDRRAFVRIAAALALGVVAQLLSMVALFGEPFSVSSLLKVTHSGILQGDFTHVVANVTGSKAQLVRFLAVLVLVALAAANIVYTSERDARVRKAALILAILAFFATPFLLIAVRSWYLLPVHLMLFYIATRPDVGGGKRLQRGAARCFAVAMCAAYLVGTTVYHHRFRNDQVNSAYFVKHLETLVPKGAEIYQVDGSGYVGYFSANPVINGDGLVNSYAYARRLRDDALSGYLAENRICWVIANRRDADPARIVDFHGLVVPAREASLVFRVPGDGVNRYADYRLYRLKRPDCGVAAATLR